jgi:hypothetical protein
VLFEKEGVNRSLEVVFDLELLSGEVGWVDIDNIPRSSTAELSVISSGAVLRESCGRPCTTLTRIDARRPLEA